MFCFGNEQTSWDKQKHKKDKGKLKKQARGFLFLSMCQIEICTYTHPYLIYNPQNTPPVQPWTLRSKDTQRNVIKQAKEGRPLWMVGCKGSHVTWRWDLAGINIKKGMSGALITGRGWITLVQYWEQHTILATSGGLWVLGKWVSSTAGFSGYPGCQSWLYFNKGNL